MTHKKKQQFVAPAIRVVKMHSECTIMAASEGSETGGIKSEPLELQNGTFDFSTGTLK